MPSTWTKGKQRASPETVSSWQRRDDSGSMGNGEGDGLVVPLEYVGTTAYNAAYTLPILLGSNNLNVSLQIDTGSSDFWVTASSCGTSACSNVPGNKRYDPSSSSTSLNSGAAFDIKYLQGHAAGTVIWDTANIGGYSISNQALAVANTVDSEPLSGSFNGVLGLALPDNSIISQLIPATDSSSPDGAQFTSNIFSLSPSSRSPAARFLSLTLSRPGSSTIPSLFGIGKHPPQSLVPAIGNGTNVHYSSPIASLTSTGISAGQLFWKSNVRGISVWVDGQERVVTLQKSGHTSYPTAVLDTGVPVILATKAIADAIYGAIGVSPASDGNYYLDCKTPLNLTISLDDRAPISVHPLDLTTQPPSNSGSSSNCIGLIQAADSYLGSIGDMILGVPFIRNTYMVMAYEVPNSDGTFADLRPGDDTQSSTDASISNQLFPRLGLQGLTNATTAMQEFQNVRVLGQPMNGSQAANSDSSGKKPLSIGLDVLFGLIGFFGLCFLLFGIRFCVMKRRYANSGPSVDGHGPPMRTLGNVAPAGATGAAAGGGLYAWFRSRNVKKGQYAGDQKDLGAYELAGRTSPTTDSFPSEDALRQARYHAYIQKERMTSEYSTSSDRTRIGDLEEGEEGEMGLRKKESRHVDVGAHDTTKTAPGHDIDWNPVTGLEWNRDTLVGVDEPKHRKGPSEGSLGSISQSPERRPLTHGRNLSGSSGSRSRSRGAPSLHIRGPSEIPLQTPEEDAAMTEEPIAMSPEAIPQEPPASWQPEFESNIDLDLGEFGGMAGVGTARRNERLRSESLDISGDAKGFGMPLPIPDRSPSSLSTSSRSRGRPTRAPSGPRTSTLSNRQSQSTVSEDH